MEVTQLENILKSKFPLQIVDSWDNVGKIVSFSDQLKIAKVLITNDVTSVVIQEAIDEGFDCIISYHPLLLVPEKTINEEDYPANLTFKLIRNNITLFTLHTSLDLEQESMTENILSFLKESISSVRVISPNSCQPSCGYGRLTTLKEKVAVKDIFKGLKRSLNIETFKFAGNKEAPVRRIGTLCGSGFKDLHKVIKECELIITGELTYFQVMRFVESGVNVILLGHSVSERHYMSLLKERLDEAFKGEGVDLETKVSEEDKYIIEYV